VLLAVFIGSIVLTVLYASFFQINKAKARIEEELELYHEARIIMSKITRDLATAFPRGLVNSQSTYITTPFFYGVEEGEKSKLSFTSLSRTPTQNSRESDQTVITYFLEPIQDSDLFALVTTPRSIPKKVAPSMLYRNGSSVLISHTCRKSRRTRKFRSTQPSGIRTRRCLSPQPST
jgi:type II secretory pathway component PulJ